MNRLRGHRGLVVTICVFIVVCVIILFSLSNIGSIDGAGKAAQSGTTAVESPVASAGNGISDFFYGLTHFGSIQEENERLKAEISDLESQLTDAKLSSEQFTELRNMQNELNTATYDDSYDVVTASVTAYDESQFFDIFTVNAGTSDGVDKGDIVVNSDGLIGHVTEVGKNWAKVTGISDSDTSVSFMLLRDPEVIGVISGDAKNHLQGYVFDETKSVLEGDTMVTTGMGTYPAGIRIGKITDISIDSGTEAKTVKGESTVNFKSLRFVTILSK